MQLAEPPTALLDEASLFLDIDGTLVELASTPDGVVVETELLDLLATLQQKLCGRVALLSGRGIADIRQLLGTVQLPMGGSHGLERLLPNGDHSLPRPPPGLEGVAAALRRLESDHPGVLIEEKPAGIAVHYRLAPDAERACQEAAADAAAAIGMALQQGKMVVELKPPGADKGTALRWFMSERPFTGSRPIFIGDDLTDEHGFVAVREFGGAGVLVGPARATAACYRLDDVTAVRNWLAAACGELA